MIITNADKVPANSKVIIFRQFISFEGFTVSRETAIHIIAETMATMTITPLDIFETSLIDILFEFYIPLKGVILNSVPNVRIRNIKVSLLNNLTSFKNIISQTINLL